VKVTVAFRPVVSVQWVVCLHAVGPPTEVYLPNRVLEHSFSMRLSHLNNRIS